VAGAAGQVQETYATFGEQLSCHGLFVKDHCLGAQRVVVNLMAGQRNGTLARNSRPYDQGVVKTNWCPLNKAENQD